MDSENDKNKKGQTESGGKIELQGVNQEPVLKSPSKFAQYTDDPEFGILTADDVNTNLFALRTEMMAETESRTYRLQNFNNIEMFSSLIQGHKAIESAQKDLLEKLVEFEHKLNSGTVAADVNHLKSSVQGKQKNYINLLFKLGRTI